jgi:zinc protease
MVNSKIAAEDLAKELGVVRNELEVGESSPALLLRERMMASAYLWHGYGRAPMGSRSDLEQVPPEALRAFYTRHYRPDNAIVALAGRFEEAKALALVQQYFGAVARPPTPLPHAYTVEPVQDGERTVVLRRRGDIALVGFAYHAVPAAHEDALALDAAVHALAAPASGRLYQALVPTGMASSVSGELLGLAEPGVSTSNGSCSSREATPWRWC